MRSLPLALFTALALAQIGLNPSDAHAAGKSMPRVGVIVLSIGNTPASAADNLTEILIAAVSQLDKYEIVGKEEFQSILGVQSEKRALTCLHDTTCLSKVGLELGITEVLVGNVSKRDGVWSLVLDRVDVRRSKVMRHLFYDTDKGEEELHSAVFSLADQLFAPVEEPPPKPEPMAEVKPTPPLEKPNDTLRHAAYGAVGLGVVFGAVAAIYGLRVRNTAAEVTGRCCIDGAGARQIYDMTREEALTTRDDVDSLTTVVNVMFVGSVLSIGAGVALLLVAPDGSASSTFPLPSLMPAQGGGLFSLSGGF